MMFSEKWLRSTLVGGNRVLDYLNYSDAWEQPKDRNRLITYSSLVAWAEAANLINTSEREKITTEVLNHSFEADQELTRLTAWAEVMHRVLSRLARAEHPLEADWRTMESSVQDAICNATLVRDGDGVATWKTNSDLTGLKTIPHRFALELHALLTGHLVAKIKQCEGCTWLFLDTSKNGQRRWCSMATCGNKAKARRFHETKGA